MFRIVLVAALLLCQGCGFYYKALKQDAGPPARITHAAGYRVRPISFEKLAKPDDYETEQQWREETRALIPEFNDEVTDLAGGEGLSSRLRMVSLDEPVKEGVLVEPVVVGVVREWSVFAGGFDFLEVELTFTDTASGEVLFKGRLMASSKRYGPVGWRAQSFSGRMALASWNVVPAIISVIKQGKIIPEVE